MIHAELSHSWKIDLKAGLAACGAVLISFAERPDRNLDIAFVSGASGSLEEQCLLAGQAMAAIQAKIRWAGVPDGARPALCLRRAPESAPGFECLACPLDQAA